MSQSLSQMAYRHFRPSDFGRVMLVAAALHLAALLAIVLWPEQEVKEIPVRAMSIRLGADMSKLAKPAPAAPVAKPPAVAKPVPKPAPKKVSRPAPKKQSKEVSFKKKLPAIDMLVDEPRRAPVQQAAAPVTSVSSQPSHYVRAAPEGQSGGESETPEQARARYEQVMSAWLQRHRMVPEMARKLGQHGSPVLRVRINRQGAVKYFAIERSSGYQLIDHAAMDMVRRANPFPATPANYPGGQVLEFLIPVTFDLK